MEIEMRLCGNVTAMIYQNADTGYTVLKIDCDDEEEELCAVGIMPLVTEGETVELEGDFMIHKTYGRQFVISSFSGKLPEKETAIFHYLSSGIIRGVGPKIARMILDRFGPDSLYIMENEPERLTEIRGISPEKAKKMQESLKETQGIKEILMFLQQYSITSSLAFKIYKHWGMRSCDIIRKNPYRLCEIAGISFEKADDIASQMELSPGSTERIQAGMLYILNHNMNNGGHTFLPKEKLFSVCRSMLDPEESALQSAYDTLIENRSLVYRPKISNTDGVYLRWVYECEENIARRICLSAMMKRNYPSNFEKDIAQIEKDLGLHFAENQKEAIREAYLNHFMVLTGGPGTGKTTTLNGIIRLFEQNGISFAIAAPTGRAAKRVTELSGKEAKTIHRLLEYSAEGDEWVFVRCAANPLKCDAVIVDEASMVDPSLFDRLLNALPATSSVLLVGDANQLPSVGAGSLLKDIIASSAAKTVELNEIFRQAKESLIITNAHRIIRGEMPELADRKRDFFFLPAYSPDAVCRTVGELLEKRLPKAYGYDPKTEIQVLCPSRKGMTGSGNLNVGLQRLLNPETENKRQLEYRGGVFREGDKVMQIKNNYDVEYEGADGKPEKGIFNGDIGIIERVYEKELCLAVLFDDKRVIYPREMLDELEPAYAVTVHKSQGSEWPAVILPLFDCPDMLSTRNLLYTAVTRARKQLILVGSEKKIAQMVQNNISNKRYSGLKFLLKEYTGQ